MVHKLWNAGYSNISASEVAAAAKKHLDNRREHQRGNRQDQRRKWGNEPSER